MEETLANLKKGAYEFCVATLEAQLSKLHTNISGIQEALSSETKSSAGDKHETGRAMLQLEREKIGAQLQIVEKNKEILNKINLSKKQAVTLGCLVKTNKAYYFISVSTGAYKQDNTTVYCISAMTPIGKLLIGKTKGDSVVFNGETSTILDLV